MYQQLKTRLKKMLQQIINLARFINTTLPALVITTRLNGYKKASNIELTKHMQKAMGWTPYRSTLRGAALRLGLPVGTETPTMNCYYYS